MEQVLENHIHFYEDQVRESELEYQTYLSTPLVQLFQNEQAFFGNIVGVNNEKGHAILKIRKNHCPRLKIPKTFCILRNDAWSELGTKITQWSCTCRDFLEKSKYHTIFSEIKPLYFVKRNDPDYDYIGCTSIDLGLFNSITKGLNDGKSVWFTMFDGFPPTQYLLNLKNYTEWHQSDENLLITPKISYEEWQPKDLSYTDDIPGIIIKTLTEKGKCVLQGPPGTGKSYTIAQIVKQYLEANKTVCVTTMSNKGIVELAAKKPLDEIRNNGKIKKTLLTADERHSVPGLQLADKSLHIANGELLCTTYYILSGKFKDINYEENTPIYDLIVIEEASQAYLTTIAAFTKLGKQCLIVGDPMQLPPIILNENKSEYKYWDVKTLATGLKTLVLGSDITSYRITTSFRLTEAGAKLSGVFYNNSLTSVQKEPVLYPLIENSNLYPLLGGTLLYTARGATDSICSDSALSLISKVVGDIEKNYPQRSIAIISPFRDTVQRIQKDFYYEHQSMDIVVETIDRIQGITVDYAILYFPLRNIGFALSENRFNVATSRSRSTTLIISDMPLIGFSAISGNIANYLDRCPKLSSDISRVSIPKVEPTKPVVMPIKSMEEPINGVKVVGNIDLSKFERPKKELQPEKKNYYIIDTNVFVNFPDILSKIDKKYPVILSAKVTDELDKLKIKLTDQDKQNAEKALRILNNENSREIIYEFSDVSLLPVDFDKRSPDNMILSVALKYKAENPIMLTSDNGLQLKSKILGITTISLKNFLKQSK
jgi:rRNA-processing protein FCF1